MKERKTRGVWDSATVRTVTKKGDDDDQELSRLGGLAKINRIGRGSV